MTDDAKAGAGPEIPGELWGIIYGPPEEASFVGMDANDCLVYPTQAEAERHIWRDKQNWRDRQKANTERTVLIGVHPRHRDAFHRLAKRIESLTWFVVKNERGLYEVSDEHSIGEMIVKLAAEVKAFQTRGGQG